MEFTDHAVKDDTNIQQLIFLAAYKYYSFFQKRKMQRKIFSDLDSSVGSRLSRHNELYHSCEEFVIMMNGSRGKLPTQSSSSAWSREYQEFLG